PVVWEGRSRKAPPYPDRVDRVFSEKPGRHRGFHKAALALGGISRQSMPTLEGVGMAPGTFASGFYFAFFILQYSLIIQSGAARAAR
ncbi:MAG: hypothetical protein WD045_11960, partial [Pirellulaceae bacterium]